MTVWLFALPHLDEFRVAGVVPKPACQVSQEGEHQERPGSAGAQCAPANLLRRAHLARGVGEEGAGQAGEEAAQTVGKATKEAAGNEWNKIDWTEERTEMSLLNFYREIAIALAVYKPLFRNVMAEIQLLIAVTIRH